MDKGHPLYVLKYYTTSEISYIIHTFDLEKVTSAPYTSLVPFPSFCT